MHATELTAIHEAGHAATLAYVGFPFRFAILMAPDDPSGLLGSVNICRGPIIGNPLDVRNFLGCVTAGELAVRKHFDGSFPEILEMPSSDAGMAHRTAWDRAAIEQQYCSDTRTEIARAIIRQAAHDAMEWLTVPEHWAAVSEIAEALLQSDVISQDHVKTILRRHITTPACF